MKRDILRGKRKNHINGCCPGHDDYPDDTYRSRRSKKARARDKKLEHQHARTLLNRSTVKAVEEVSDEDHQ